MKYRRFLDWTQSLSRVTRQTARREFLAIIPLAVLAGVLNPQFCGLVGRKALLMPDYLLAALMACHMTGLLLAGPLVGVFQQKRKIALLSKVIAAASVILLTVAALGSEPAHPWMSYVFLGQIFLVQMGMALVIALRSAIWRANYPVQNRAKIVVVISLCLMFVSSGAILLFTSGMDHGLSFQMVYFVSGLFGLLAALLYSRIRIRQEGKNLRRLARNEGRQLRLWAGLAVLRTDRRFRWYMSWQMLNGLATLVVEIVLVVIIADVLGTGWMVGGSVLTVVPMLVCGLAGLFWARLFDRKDIFIMRFYGTMVWVLSRVLLLVGILDQSMPIIMCSRVITGLAIGCGQLSWRLGHMAFAPPEKDSLYMGAHVSLTGVRGIIAPFLGIYLYRLDFLGPHGVWLIAITALCQALAGMGFLQMRASERQRSEQSR